MTIRLVYEPIVVPLAEMVLDPDGVLKMADWVRDRRPDCTPEGGYKTVLDLLPHDGIEPVLISGVATHGRKVTDNELLVELAGRKCYDSFAEKAGQKTNREYIKNLAVGAIPHRSVFYHAKKSYFIAQVSRRVSHELIRNYVGADRDEEGSPSQESTRFSEHYGSYIVPPYILALDEDDRRAEMGCFERAASDGYRAYLDFIRRRVNIFREEHDGAEPKGMDRKRIYEAASFYLHHSVETSFIWTTNPMAEMKLWNERCDEAADAEFQRFAKLWRKIAVARSPNLYPGVEV